MSSAIITDTDEEMAKYDEALLIAQNHPPMDTIKDKKIAFNTELGVDEVLYPMQGGGYVKVGEMPKDKTREIKGYAQGTTFSVIYEDSAKKDFSSSIDSLLNKVDLQMLLILKSLLIF